MRRSHGAAHDAGRHRFMYGQENIGIVAATGCNTVYTSTYPYNPYKVSWTNSLFENARPTPWACAPLDQLGWSNKRLWIIGGDGAMNDIGFQSLSRMMAAGLRYQGAGARYPGLLQHRRPGLHQLLQGQDAKMSFHGSAISGKKGKPQRAGHHLHDAQGRLRAQPPAPT